MKGQNAEVKLVGGSKNQVHLQYLGTSSWVQYDMEHQEISVSTLDCPLSKGNQANHPKFERPNGKNTKSKSFF